MHFVFLYLDKSQKCLEISNHHCIVPQNMKKKEWKIGMKIWFSISRKGTTFVKFRRFAMAWQLKLLYRFLNVLFLFFPEKLFIKIRGHSLMGLALNWKNVPPERTTFLTIYVHEVLVGMFREIRLRDYTLHKIFKKHIFCLKIKLYFLLNGRSKSNQIQ